MSWKKKNIEGENIVFKKEIATLILKVPESKWLDRLAKIQKEYGLLKKEEFHITVIGTDTGEAILKRLEGLDAEKKESKLREIENLARQTKWAFCLKFDYRFISKTYPPKDGYQAETRKSIIQLAKLPNVESFYRGLNKILGTDFPVPPPHITLFTNSTREDKKLRGIGIYSKEDLSLISSRSIMGRVFLTLLGVIGKIFLNKINPFERIITVIIFTILFTWLLLPLPWEKYYPFFWGTSFEGQYPKFSKKVGFTAPLAELLEKNNLPIGARYYDVYFINSGRGAPEDCDWELQISFRRDSPFWPYAEKGFSNLEFYLNEELNPGYHGNVYSINKKNIIPIQDVPIDIPIEFGSVPFGMGNCPEEYIFPSVDRNHGPKGMDIYARPDLLSWFLQSLFFFLFSLVLANNLFDLVQKKSKQ